MNHIRLLSALFATAALAGLAACNRPEVVAVPVPAPTPMPAPSPAPIVVPVPMPASEPASAASR